MPEGENSSWYTIAKRESPLEQGDILFNISIPVFVKENGEIHRRDLLATFVIMNQSCDLIIQPGKNKPRAEHVLLAEAQESSFTLNEHKNIHIGRQAGFYILPRRTTRKHPKQHLIVNFNKLYAVHVDLLPNLASTTRTRMCSPYREHLMQAFSNTYSRIALDENPMLT